ncbi:oxidoreductase [Tothia fuscella]|uniref:Oxidoreductase n=1 Tax=Tothia fuscella TaxID=1048955 RepID=A0A9P4TRX0_9PEZI|nr:oxidoreductase [Tothia fuscella]
MSQQIRVGIIGLSAAATGTGWAASAHLPYLLKSPHYTISALCNSSVEAAQKAIAAYNLPSSTKAYGDPESLANDPDIDLVVANTRVDRHALVLLPSLKKGKDVFCEWPMDRNLDVAKEMLEAAKEGGGKAFLGLQGRQSPAVRKIKELIDGGRIGKVLSSTWMGVAGNGGGEEGLAVEYFVDRKIGGNTFTIAFMHSLDYVLHTLGDIDQYSTILGNQRPQTKIVDRSTNTLVKTVKKDTPDQMLLQAQLTSRTVLSYHLRGGKTFPSSPQFLWRIYGEKGEIEITASGALLNAGYDDEKILLHDQHTGEVEAIEVQKDEWDELPRQGRNIARLYEEFRKGNAGANVVGFEEAVGRHEIIEDMYKAWDNGTQGREVGAEL